MLVVPNDRFPAELWHMKKFHSMILGLALLGLGIVGCDKPASQDAQQTQQNATSTMTKLGPEFTSAYICPMHCEGSGSDKPGKCPVCGMDYRENEDLKKPAADSNAAH